MTGSSATPPPAFGSASDLFHSTWFVVTRNLAIFVAAVFWLGLAFWVYRDARRRIDDPWLVGTAAVVGLVPLLGPLVYLLFRPPETLAEARARDLELFAIETRLLRRPPACPVCRSEIERSYLVCPVCTTQLKRPCTSCGKPLEGFWQACPYCAAPVGAARVGEPARADLDAALAAEAAVHQNGHASASRPAAR
ncbi:MAG TPA: zinc ribbon domain-containing protein [Gaiellaceae bacterium]|nr:zinc ribbon domain-containing protein [Gaiellaceae bacterium]